MSIYEKSTRLLMLDMVSDFGLSNDDRITKPDVLAWFSERYPKIKKNTVSCHLIRLTTNANSRHHYNAKAGDDDIFFQLNKNTYRLYAPKTDPTPLGSEIVQDNESYLDVDAETEAEDIREFAYENDLQNYLAKNLDLIEPGLRVYEEDGISGIEYPAGGRFIDILAIDKNNNFVVIELKVSKGYDRVIGQLLRYVSWVKKNITEDSQTVRGIIIARNISEDLMLVCEELNTVSLFEYQLSVKLNKIETM